MISGVEKVKETLLQQLSDRYTGTYGDVQGRLLAEAVTNELFSDHPSSHESERFLKSSYEVIQDELYELQKDIEIRNIVTQTIRAKILVASMLGAKDKEAIIDPIEKLQRYGIFIPGGEPSLPVNFLVMAHEYFITSFEGRGLAE